MSAIYDNWERLVVKREQIWQLCHEHSRSPSLSSDYSSEYSTPSFWSTDEEKPDKPKLVFLGCSEAGFRIKHSLKGLRELGKGTFGTTLLTQLSRDVRVSEEELLEKGTKMAAKLLKEVKVSEEEFRECVMALQDCRHENVAPPKAYYFSAKTNGKLILYHYHTLGSVSHMLRGKKHLRDWESRKRVAIGAARGVAHIHNQCDGKMAHGNIKSSNIFLNSDQYGCVSDIGLTSFFIASTGLKPWGFFQERDVYMFGILLLELLTGKSSKHGVALMRWARSVKYEELRGGLMDPRLEYDEGDWLEMVEVLCIAMKCVEEYTICRMCDVVFMLESISRPYKIWGSWM